MWIPLPTYRTQFSDISNQKKPWRIPSENNCSVWQLVKNGPHITKIISSLSASDSIAVSQNKNGLPAAKHLREQASVKCSFSHLLLAWGQKTHSLRLYKDVTYSLDSYSNGAVSAPRLIGHLFLLTENCTIIYTLQVLLSCFLSHPKHAPNSKVVDNLHTWSAVMDGFKPFRKGGVGRWDGELHFSWVQLECRELHLGMNSESAENLWVRISRQTNMGSIVVGVCYRPPAQEQVDETSDRS